jgi:hypothetical protein
VPLSDTGSGLQLVYAKVKIPACIITPNIHFRVTAGFSHTATGGTVKTLKTILSSNDIAIGGEIVTNATNVEMAGMTAQTNAASSALQASVSCRNSVTSQGGVLVGWRSQAAIAPGTGTSTFNMTSATHYLYITSLKATNTDTMTLEDHVVEVC